LDVAGGAFGISATGERSLGWFPPMIGDRFSRERQLRREARFWARGDPLSELWFGKQTTGRVARYANELVSGDPGKPWFTIIGDSRRYERGCSLGSGASLLEGELMRLGVVGRWDLYDLSRRVLCRAKRSMGDYGDRVTLRVADVNRVNLPAHSYDLILCFTSLHHFVELEQILDEVAHALTEDGLFLVWDFVGETRMQWLPERIAFQQSLLEQVPEQFHVSAHARIQPADVSELSPFEAVRSADIPPLLQERFRPELWKTFCGALVPLLLYVRTDDLERERPDIFERLINVDRELSEHPSSDFMNPQLCALLRRR